MKLNIDDKQLQCTTPKGEIIIEAAIADTSLQEQTTMIVRALRALIAQKGIHYMHEELVITTTNKLLLALDKGSTITESYKPYVHEITRHMQLLPFEEIVIVPACEPFAAQQTENVTQEVATLLTADQVFM